MTGVLLRTCSTPFQRLNLTGSLKSTLSDSWNDAVFPPRVDFHRSDDLKRGIRRSVSDTNIFRSGSSRISAIVSPSFPSRIVEAEEEFDSHCVSGVGDLHLGSAIPVEEDRFPGGGFGDGRRFGGDGGSDGGRGDRNDIDEYYKRMLETNPGDALLLRNYGKYLHEVVKDTVRAEECYGRAILASPGDGELLSLYGKLIWETQRDGERAQSYFDQAVHAAPDDCSVLASYAHFLWEADEEVTVTMVSSSSS
ncbi:hypothetical protein V2J09_014801 [Rumex salicifolius]